MEELDGLAEQQSVQPPAAARAGSQCNVEGNADQAGADPRARQVLDEAVGHGFKDVRAAGAPQHRGISCGAEEGFRRRSTAANTGVKASFNNWNIYKGQVLRSLCILCSSLFPQSSSHSPDRKYLGRLETLNCALV